MTKDQTDEFAALYRETQNPIHIWEALRCCQSDLPLPDWIFTYLQGCARGPMDDGIGPEPKPPLRRGLLDLDDLHRGRAITATEAKDAVARAMGFVQGNAWNAFTNHRVVERDAAMVFHIDTTSGRKRWGTIQAQTGLSRGHIFAGARAARRRWAAQQAKK